MNVPSKYLAKCRWTVQPGFHNGGSKSHTDPMMSSFKAFERYAAPARVEQITASTIDGFIAKRLRDSGRKPNSVISPATVNRDLRHLKAILGFAVRWKYLAKVAEIRMVREVQEIGEVMTVEGAHGVFRIQVRCLDPRQQPKPAPEKAWREAG